VSAADKETNYTPATRKMELTGNASATFDVNLDFANGYSIATDATMIVRGQSVKGDIANAGTFVFDIGAGKELAYTDKMSGGGKVFKEGDGKVLLSGDQSGAT
ncbi:hypothetical protein IHV25_10280, partial [Phaeovibrio sulfidiphilus]